MSMFERLTEVDARYRPGVNGSTAESGSQTPLDAPVLEAFNLRKVRMVFPHSRRLNTLFQSMRRLWGSSPEVGSSRNTTCGSLTRASAKARRCSCPPDRFCGKALAFSSMWTSSSRYCVSSALGVERAKEVYQGLEPIFESVHLDSAALLW